jgi:hypothetical protein
MQSCSSHNVSTIRLKSRFCLFSVIHSRSDTTTVSYCKSRRSLVNPSSRCIHRTSHSKNKAAYKIRLVRFIQLRVSCRKKAHTVTRSTSLDTSVVLCRFSVVAPRNMQTFSHSLGQKRPLLPGAQFERVFEGKRRAIINDKPILQVDTMLQMDKMLPYRRTPELGFFSRTSPFRSQPYAPYADALDFSTALGRINQNMMAQTASDWTQYAGAMHTTLSTNNLQYHSEAEFLESCKTSLESFSSYTVLSGPSGVSSSSNPFVDFCSTWTPDPFSSPPAETDANMNDSINAAIMRLQKLQDSLVEQSSIVEEVMQVLQGSCKSRNRP